MPKRLQEVCFGGKAGAYCGRSQEDAGVALEQPALQSPVLNVQKQKQEGGERRVCGTQLGPSVGNFWTPLPTLVSTTRALEECLAFTFTNFGRRLVCSLKLLT